MSDMREVRIDKGEALKIIVRRLFRSVCVTFAVSLVLYVLCAIFLGRYLVTDQGTVFVVSPSFSGGTVPRGETIMVGTNSEHGDSFANNFLDAFKMHTDIASVEVLAGPYGSARVDKESVTVDDEVFRSDVSVVGNVQDGVLKNQYVVKCVSGKCEQGGLLILPASAVAGVEKELF